MAKKVIATLKTGMGKTFTRCIKAVKSPKTGAYLYKEEMVHVDHIKDYFLQK
jgi:ABC-type histidine transport system ATPase subunit